jgi:Gas vesicle synthesis protein GvpO
MAQSRQSRNRRSTGQEDGHPGRDAEQEERADEAGDERPSGGDRSGPGLTAKELTEAALSTIADLTGFEPESASGLQWDGESWLVTVDVLELARIPSTTDVLATYVVQLDDGGGLLGYKRVRRFLRSQLEDE